ncbi:MAG: hypothetical protein ACHQKY_05955 [Terriglobia bacterium]|jgi:hypothetical protein
MGRWSSRRGGTGSFIFWVVVLALIIYLGVKFIPPYVSSNEFVDAMDYEAKEAGAGNRDEGKVRLALMIKAKELKLPVKDSSIKVTRLANQVSVEVQYTILVDLPFGKSYLWHFSPRVTKPVLQ